ncbi:MAG TPA: PEP-CTERM sorting domain-containing protein, partial [Tepidisphaeraceae bacterium]
SPSAFNNSGTLRGASTADTLTYVSLLTGRETQQLALSSSGVIAPGAGTGGAGLASVGALTLKGANVTFTGVSGALNIDVGGTATGEFDTLSLAAGTSNAAGTLDLTAATLNVSLVNGFAPPDNFSINILNYGSEIGTPTLLVNGVSDSRYALQIGATSANLVYSVPEPASLTGLALAAGLLMRRRLVR